MLLIPWPAVHTESSHMLTTAQGKYFSVCSAEADLLVEETPD